MNANISTIKHTQYGKEYVEFRPHAFFQEVQAWHAAQAGLEFKMDFSSGKNQARVNMGTGVTTDPSAEVLKAATMLVPDCEKKHDHNLVCKRLINAATWNKVEEVAYILRSCYCVQEAGLLALQVSLSYRGLYLYIVVISVSV